MSEVAVGTTARVEGRIYATLTEVARIHDVLEIAPVSVVQHADARAFSSLPHPGSTMRRNGCVAGCMTPRSKRRGTDRSSIYGMWMLLLTRHAVRRILATVIRRSVQLIDAERSHGESTRIQ
jgi:hypothetical protein